MAFGFYTPFPVDHTKVGASDSTNFPVLLSGSDARFKSVGNGGHVQSSSGFDLRPYADTGAVTAKTYELVTYNATLGTFELWYKEPTLSHTVDTPCSLFYGDATLTTDGSSSSTWNANHKLVLHLKDGTTLSATDSTSLGHNGTITGASATTGKIDGGASFASGNNISVASSTDFDSTTGAVALWFKTTQSGTTGPVFIDRHGSAADSKNGIVVFINPSPFNLGAQVWDAFSELSLTGTTTALNDGAWHRIWFLFNSNSTATLYVDNHAEASGSPAAVWGFSGQAVKLATSPDTFWNPYVGSMDEVRWMNNNPSADWITADYNNQNAPSTFNPMGTEVAVGAAARRAAITQVRNPDAVPFDGGMQLRRRAIPSNPPIVPQGTHVYLFKNLDGDPFGGHVLLSRPVVVRAVVSSILQRRTLHGFGTHTGGRTVRGDS